MICLCPLRLLSNETTGGRVSSMEFHRWLLLPSVGFASTLCFSSFSSSNSSVKYWSQFWCYKTRFGAHPVVNHPGAFLKAWKAYVENKLRQFAPRPVCGRSVADTSGVYQWSSAPGMHLQIQIHWSHSRNLDRQLTDTCHSRGAQKDELASRHNITQPYLQGSSARKLVYYKELYRTEILRFWYWILAAHL